MTEYRGVARLLLGAAAIIVATSAVALAATYAAQSDANTRISESAVVYGASESFRTAATVTHTRLSEAVVATASLASGEVDEDRLIGVRAALTELQTGLDRLAPVDRDRTAALTGEYVVRAEGALANLEAGRIPLEEDLAGLDRTYTSLVGEVDDIRGEYAELLTAARNEAGTLATAASVFVTVVIPVLVLSGTYRALRNRQRRKELEVILASERQLHEERDRLLQAVGHELRTPLTAVVGFSATLRDEAADLPSEWQDVVVGVSEQAQELSDRIDDLLAISRIDSRSLHLRPERVEIREVIERIIASRPHLGSDRVTVTGRGLVRVDPLHLEHVLRNLILGEAQSVDSPMEVLVRPRSMTLDIEIRRELEEAGDGGEDEDGAELYTTSGPGIRIAAAQQIAEYLGGTIRHFRGDAWSVWLLRFPIAPASGEDVASASGIP